MVVSAGGSAVGTQGQPQPGVVTGRPRGRTRREAGRGLLTAVATLALAPLVAASRPPNPATESESTGGVGGGRAVNGGFDETYHGRHIQGAMLPAAGRALGDGEWQVTVDGHPLHLMRRADGTWLTMLDHYSSYRTPLEATRAAVDELGPGERLRDPESGEPGTDHITHLGEHHGVRA